MHGLIKKNLLNLLDKKLEKDEVAGLVDQANSIFPNSKHLYGQVLNGFPDLLANLECLLEKAEEHNIGLYKILELRKNLMLSHLYRMDYKQYKYQLDWFATKKQDIIAGSTSAAQLLPAVIFLLFTGGYKQYIEDKTKEAIGAFEEAIKIIKDRNLRDIKCYVYQQYAQVLLCSGEVDSAWEEINVAKEELDNNPNAIVDKGMLYFTFGNVFLERGEQEVALEYFNKSIDARREFGKVPANEFSYVGKSEVLLRAGKYQEALKVSRESYKRADGYFEKDHELKNRILIFVAWAEIGCGEVKKAEKSIARAKAWYDRVKDVGDRNGGRYLVYISIVEGEIATHKKDYAQAVEKYIEARERLLALYSNLKTDFYGFVLERLLAALSLAKNDVSKAQYLTEYDRMFGKKTGGA
jgi:tetratricopeptide (TPR) repeat protein